MCRCKPCSPAELCYVNKCRCKPCSPAKLSYLKYMQVQAMQPSSVEYLKYMQVQAMLEAVWAEHREMWRVCASKAKKALEHQDLHAPLTDPPTMIPASSSTEGAAHRPKHGHSLSEAAGGLGWVG